MNDSKTSLIQHCCVTVRCKQAAALVCLSAGLLSCELLLLQSATWHDLEGDPLLVCSAALSASQAELSPMCRAAAAAAFNSS
jgi:hypothetical protein